MNTSNETNTQIDLSRVLEKITEIAEKSADGDYIYRGEPECYLNVGNNRKHNAPLITTERIEWDYKIQWDSRCGKYLVGAQGSSDEKAEKLREISNGLDDIEMKIIVESPDGQQEKY